MLKAVNGGVISGHGGGEISSHCVGAESTKPRRGGALCGIAAMLAWGNYVEKLTAPDEASNIVDLPRVASGAE